jgi:hypothetical protein
MGGNDEAMPDTLKPHPGCIKAMPPAQKEKGLPEKSFEKHRGVW